MLIKSFFYLFDDFFLLSIILQVILEEYVIIWVVMIRMEEDMEKRNPVLAAMERQGVLKGRKECRKECIDEGTLRVLNQLVNDSSNNYSVEQLAEKFGYSVEEILNANNLREN